MNKKSLLGMEFGLWKVIGDNGGAKVECECICGERRMVYRDNLLGDKSHGCTGCSVREKT